MTYARRKLVEVSTLWATCKSSSTARIFAGMGAEERRGLTNKLGENSASAAEAPAPQVANGDEPLHALAPGRLAIGVLAWCLLLPAFAAPVNIGLFSFDTLIPGDPSAPGVNGFTILNLTGDPAAGGFALPPEFPVYTSLSLEDATLALDGQVFGLGDIGPGGLTPPALFFPDTALFSSAIFSARLSQTGLTLFDGTIFTAASPFVSARLLPSSGPNLEPGVDFVLLSVSEVPEPGSFLPALVGLGFILARQRRFKQN